MKTFNTGEASFRTNPRQGGTWTPALSTFDGQKVLSNRLPHEKEALQLGEDRRLLPFSKVGLIALFLMLGNGCASMGHGTERYIACSYDQVWESSLHTVKEYPMSQQDKDAGILETEWIETAVQNRPYGLFSREGLPEKQRFRTRVELTPYKEVTAIRISERREHWGFRGGAQIYKWFPVEPSDESLQHFLNILITPLEKQGCLVES